MIFDNRDSDGVSGGYSPLGGPLGDPDGLLDLNAFQPGPALGPQELIARARTQGVLPQNIGAEIEGNPVIERAAVLYLSRYDDVVTVAEFEDRFTAVVIEAARLYRADERELLDAADIKVRDVVNRTLDLLDGGVLRPAEAEEAITWPDHLPKIEQIAYARLLEGL